MELLWCAVIGVLIAVGIFLMLERHLVQFLFGLMVVSNAINLAIFVAGRLTLGMPPLVASNALVPPEGTANPLPQALILTAIVIGFGLILFTLLLSYRTSNTFASADSDGLCDNERMEQNP